MTYRYAYTVKVEYLAHDRLSAVTVKRSAMVSSASGDQSLSLSLSSGRTITRLSTDSPEEQGAMATPSLIMTDTGERIYITDRETVEASEDASSSMIIVDAVMNYLSSSLVVSGAMGAIGSSESRGKSRSPPRASVDRPDRSAPNTPLSRVLGRAERVVLRLPH